MNILVTGAKGFVGRNLVENLKNIRDGKNQTRPKLFISEIFEYDLDTDPALLEIYCSRANFIFHFAGVNRPKNISEFMKGNYEFSLTLLDTLKECNNICPVMLSSSIQASLTGRFGDSEYGKSKLAGEKIFFSYAEATRAKVLVYRFPNLFGKWCKPNYNSALSTFCNAVANDLEYTVNDPSIELELLYIDDLVNEMLDAMEGKEHRCSYDGLNAIPSDKGKYCFVPTTYHVTLGEIMDLLNNFKTMPLTFLIPEMPEDSFAKKLYSTYLSYLPKNKMSYTFKPHVDERGCFSELIRTLNCGQISINVAKPGIIRGQHWHNSKWEIFIVISGHGLIQERRIGLDPATNKTYPVVEFEVRGDQMKAVKILPGYTHSIINLSKTQDLITIIWSNEVFDENKPDTFYESVIAEDMRDESKEKI